MTEKTNPCTGECCSRFSLKRGSKKRLQSSEILEKQYIGDMLVYLGADPKHKGESNYTCSFWDRETKLCMAYESRPSMCSLFPYDGVCGICGMIGPEAKLTAPLKTVFCCSFHRFKHSGSTE